MKGLLLIAIMGGLLVCVIALSNQYNDISSNITLPSSSPTFEPIQSYSPPNLKEADAYTVIFVGDSMTEALGTNFDYLREGLTKEYPDKVFGLFNYGFGSTSILSVEERLSKSTTYNGNSYEAILGRAFEVIIIESFGHNPLSEYPIEEGLKKQEEVLDKVVTQLANHHPTPVIMFLATIAPSKTHYALGERDLSAEQRAQWAEERRIYIENHIDYAKEHNIPLINVYEKTLDSENNAILEYINNDAYIHPSSTGLRLISEEIIISLREVLPH